VSEFERRYSLPFEEAIEGRAQVHYGAVLDRTVILAPGGRVKIGAARLVQCVVVEPCVIADSVIAVAAILQGDIGFGCHIEAHADIRGTLDEYVEVGRGAKVYRDAHVGRGAHLGDRCTIEEGAEIGAGASIGVGAVVREGAFVEDGSRVPAKAQIPRGGHWDPTDARQQPRGDTVALQLVESEDDDEDEEEWEEDDWWRTSDEEFEPEGPWEGGGKMVRGRPMIELTDFNPGTSRSWALTKLARIAALEGPQGRIDKKLIRRYRPDLIDHPVTAEALRVQPPMTATQLNEESWLALSKAHYDLYTGVKFHSGDSPEWQMIGPKPNDVFVLAVPVRVIREVAERTGIDAGEIRMQLFGDKTEWHPDQGVDFPVGWVRTLLYPRALMVVIEVQSDRPWMKFDWKPQDVVVRDDPSFGPDYEYEDSPASRRAQRRAEESLRAASQLLRDMYFESFAQDAINMVVEWAFSHRYGEVFILDQKSRRKLGGHPPKDYYDTVPKRYTKLGLQPLPTLVKTYGWVPEGLVGRSIRPNRGLS